MSKKIRTVAIVVFVVIGITLIALGLFIETEWFLRFTCGVFFTCAILGWVEFLLTT